MNKINQLRAERPVLFWYVATYLLVYLPAMVLLPESVTDEYTGFFSVGGVVYLPLVFLTILVAVPIIVVWAMLGVEGGWIDVLSGGAIFGWLFIIGWAIGGFSAKALPNEHHHDGVYHRHAGAHHYHYHPDPSSDAYIVLQ